MSEQLAEKLNLDLPSHEVDSCQPTISTEPESPEYTNNNSEEDVETNSDALLAKMLQNEFNREFNRELDDREAKMNRSHKVVTSLRRYRLSVSESSAHSTDSTFSEDEEQDLREMEEDASYFEDVGRKLDFTLRGRNAAFDQERNEYVSKHDVQTCYKKNAQKMESFPLNFNTGDTNALSLNNNIYNNLKSHAWKEKRSQAKTTEQKDNSTAEHGVDSTTRLLLYKLVNNGVLESVNGVISVGKEAVVLHAKGGTATPDNQLNSLRKAVPENIAVKVFKTTMGEFRHRDKYIQDDYRFCDRFKKINAKKLAHLWAEKECRNLERLESSRIACPEVVLLKKHMLFLRFIGNVSGTGGNSSSAAPKLAEFNSSKIDEKIKLRMWQQVRDIMMKMYNEAKLVHADLSEFNLLWHENRVWVIDVAQAVEPHHPKALEFLYRDCCNICKFFGGKLQLQEVPNPRQLFLEISGVDMNIEISNSSYSNDRPDSKETAEFTSRLEEIQRRSKENADAKRNADFVRLDDERVVEIKDI